MAGRSFCVYTYWNDFNRYDIESNIESMNDNQTFYSFLWGVGSSFCSIPLPCLPDHHRTGIVVYS